MPISAAPVPVASVDPLRVLGATRCVGLPESNALSKRCQQCTFDARHGLASSSYKNLAGSPPGTAAIATLVPRGGCESSLEESPMTATSISSGTVTGCSSTTLLDSILHYLIWPFRE